MVDIICQGLTFTKVQAIFFDKDGTLEDSRLFLWELAMRRAAELAIVAPEMEEITPNLLLSFGIGDPQSSWQSKNRKLDPQGLMAVGSYEENKLAAAAYIASQGYGWWESQELAEQAFQLAGEQITPDRQNSPLFPSCLEVIKSLHGAGLMLGIISADSLEGIKSFVTRENIGEYFQVLLGSDRDLSKPNPLLYLKACELLGVDPKNTLMVGDAIGDIVMAQQANAQGTIGITWGEPDVKHLSTASVTIDNLAAIRLI